jgi:LysM repeat protein
MTGTTHTTFETPAKNLKPANNRRLSSVHNNLRTPLPPNSTRRESTSRFVLSNVNTNIVNATPAQKPNSLKPPATPCVVNTGASISKLKQQDVQQRNRIAQLEEQLSSLESSSSAEKTNMSLQIQGLEDRLRETEQQLMLQKEESRVFREKSQAESENMRCREHILTQNLQKFTDLANAMASVLERYGVNPSTLQSFEICEQERKRIEDQRRDFEETCKQANDTYERSRDALQRESQKLDHSMNEFGRIVGEWDTQAAPNTGLYFGVNLQEMERIRRVVDKIKSEKHESFNYQSDQTHLMTDD